MSKKIYGFKKNKCAEPLNVLLWSNPNPTEAIGATNIELSSDDFDIYECFYKTNINNTNIQSTKSIKGSGFMLISTDGYKSMAMSRGMYAHSDNHKEMTIADAYANSEETSNDFCVPLYIIGYKTGLFE